MQCSRMALGFALAASVGCGASRSERGRATAFEDAGTSPDDANLPPPGSGGAPADAGPTGAGGGAPVDAGPTGAGGAGFVMDPDPCEAADARCDCGELRFAIETKQSCSMDVLPGHELDGEGFIEVGGKSHRVFAMDRWGSGHVVAWCDGTTLPLLIDAFDAMGYLSQSATPRVASFGDSTLCNPAYSVEGKSLPAEYLGQTLPDGLGQDPAQLAAAYDVVVFCGFRIPWNPAWASTLSRFVTEYGKGLLVVMEYESLATDADFASMSAVTRGAGIVFNPLSLPWTPATSYIDAECVPDLPSVR